MLKKVWDEITYPFPNFNDATVDVWKWISKFIQHFIIDVIAYTCWGLGVGGAVRFLVVGTIGKEERPPRGQLWMEPYLILLKYWPV